MTTINIENKKIKTTTNLFLVFLFCFFSSQLSAQTKTINVKGIVTSEVGPLDGVNIYLKNSSVGTVSKANGNFAFPQKLKVGDVIIFSYLGYVKQSVVLSPAASSLEIFMLEAPIDVLSTPNSNKPYKSKRPRRRQ